MHRGLSVFNKELTTEIYGVESNTQQSCLLLCVYTVYRLIDFVEFIQWCLTGS